MSGPMSGMTSPRTPMSPGGVSFKGTVEVIEDEDDKTGDATELCFREMQPLNQAEDEEEDDFSPPVYHN